LDRERVEISNQQSNFNSTTFQLEQTKAQLKIQVELRERVED